ncbi:MAG TPA: right-handed parallel beta-helix repeat-containing protein, partial [Prolixibacteraceae bacterium]|nr:right-handed parallel beta-helix repeat-containing protein [Prolixibacteraceae bacterium]
MNTNTSTLSPSLNAQNCALLILLLFALGSSAFAQPSGGPYGPVSTTYEIPTDAGRVYFVSPDGILSLDGTSADAPTTLEKAIREAGTGDVIVLRGGTYRTGNLRFNQSITLQPYGDERPVLKGTRVAKQWHNPQTGLWFTYWDTLFPSAPADWWRLDREIRYTPLHRFNDDMVFVNGRMLQSAGWQGELDENTFFIDYATKKVYLGFDPTEQCIEITAFNNALIRTTKEVNGKSSDGIGPKIKGITFTQYAYRAIEVEGKEPDGLSDEADHGKDVVGTLFENCTLSFCSRVAGYFRGDRTTFRNCRISDTSTEGIYIISSNDVLLERNVFTRNNMENITGYFPAAVKIFNQSYRVTCNDNLIIDHPNSNGIWYDVGNVDGVFTNNRIENVGTVRNEIATNKLWPSQNGFFFEISKGVVCAGNVFVNCDHGMLILNSCDAKIYQNTFFNSIACIGRDQRSAQGDHFGWHPSTGPDVDERDGHIFVNNLLSGDNDFKRPLMFVWQPDVMCEQ